jgi:hypothetical protein
VGGFLVSEQSWPTSGTPGREDPEHFKPLQGLAVAAMIGVALSMVGNFLYLVATWRAVNAVNAFLDGAGSQSDALAAADFADGLILPLIGVIVVTGIPFLVWLWRARGNAEFLAGVASQRRGRGWVIFSWFTPIVNFWFPFQVVTDIWTASKPAASATSTLIVNSWWATYLGSLFINRVTRNVDSVNGLLVASVLSTALYLTAGVLLYMIINGITAWQTERTAAMTQ